MNVRMLKAKRVEKNIRQKDMGKMIGLSEKSINHKECSVVNKFSADEMLGLCEVLNLSEEEFLTIFFDGKFTKTDKFSTERLNSIRNIDLRKGES